MSMNRAERRAYKKEHGDDWWNMWSSDPEHPTNKLRENAERDAQWDMYFYLRSLPWWKRIFIDKYVRPNLPEKNHFIFTNHD